MASHREDRRVCCFYIIRICSKSSEGGYGKSLGDQGDLDLSGLLKLRLRRDGIRIVYKLERSETAMKIVIVGVRSDAAVYREAARRKRRHNL